MRYTKPFNIWTTPDHALKTIQPGQWVWAGEPQNRGRFMGVSASGVTVIDWRNSQETMRLLRQFALAR